MYGGGGGGGGGTTTSTSTETPITPQYTAIDYGPLVAQAIKKRFGRQQTILGSATANRALRQLLVPSYTGNPRSDFLQQLKPGFGGSKPPVTFTPFKTLLGGK